MALSVVSLPAQNGCRQLDRAGDSLKQLSATVGWVCDLTSPDEALALDGLPVSIATLRLQRCWRCRPRAVSRGPIPGSGNRTFLDEIGSYPIFPGRLVDTQHKCVRSRLGCYASRSAPAKVR